MNINKSKILLFLALTTSVMSEGILILTADGFMFPTSKVVKTFYKGKLIWGKGYPRHNQYTPVKGVAIVAWSDSDKWKYITTTNDKGEFLIEVKPDSAFRIKGSDGSVWSTYGKILKGIPVGTIGKGK